MVADGSLSLFLQKEEAFGRGWWFGAGQAVGNTAELACKAVGWIRGTWPRQKLLPGILCSNTELS